MGLAEGKAGIVTGAAGGMGRATAVLLAREGVTSEDDHRRLVAECVARFGRLTFANNNAGVDLQGGVEATAVEDWNRVMSVNLTGVFLGMSTA
jgi:NAD(P)-dependent dehydrogenase (short-subunit alcohol dehydrogenase family)